MIAKVAREKSVFVLERAMVLFFVYRWVTRRFFLDTLPRALESLHIPFSQLLPISERPKARLQMSPSNQTQQGQNTGFQVVGWHEH